MEKPKNYEPGGREMLNKKFKNNVPQLTFIIGLIIWVISAVVLTITDIFKGIEHPFLTIPFISSILIGTYLKIRQTNTFPSIRGSQNCTKCGKNKSK
jgi:hypothetical protein